MTILAVISICSHPGSDTNIARASGMNIRASSTCSAEAAVEACAVKVARKLGLGSGAYTLTRFGGARTWTMSDVPSPAAEACPRHEP